MSIHPSEATSERQQFFYLRDKDFQRIGVFMFRRVQNDRLCSAISLCSVNDFWNNEYGVSRAYGKLCSKDRHHTTYLLQLLDGGKPPQDNSGGFFTDLYFNTVKTSLLRTAHSGADVFDNTRRINQTLAIEILERQVKKMFSDVYASFETMHKML